MNKKKSTSPSHTATCCPRPEGCASTAAPARSNTRRRGIKGSGVLTSFTHNGMTYDAPAITCSEAAIDDLAIEVGQDLSLLCDNGVVNIPFIELPDNASLAVQLTTTDAPAGTAVYVSLYREGCPQVLATRRAEHTGNFSACFSKTQSRLPAGDYLLVVSGLYNRTADSPHSVFPFHVLTSAASIRLPFSGTLVSNAGELHATARQAVVELTFAADFDAYALFNVICLDDAFRRLRVAKCYVTPHKEGETQQLSIGIEGCWTSDGKYMLVWSRQDKFVAATPFSLGGYTPCTPLPADDERIYRSIPGIEKNERAAFCRISFFPGMSKLRRQVFDLYYRRELFSTLRSKGIADYTSQACNMVVINDGYRHSGPATAIASIAGLRHGAVKEIDLGEDICRSHDNDILSGAASPFPDDYTTEHFTYVLKNLSAAFGTSGMAVIKKMKECIARHFPLVLYGARYEVEHFFELYPFMRDYFNDDYRFELGASDAGDVLTAIMRCVDGLDIDDAAMAKLFRHVTDSIHSGRLSAFSPDDARRYGMRLTQAMQARLQHISPDTLMQQPALARTLTADDIDTTFFNDNTDAVQHALGELHEMTGLREMKAGIEAIALKVQFEQKCRLAGMPLPPAQSHHMLFTGNPGTGKTTVAKKMGSIFHALGLLSKGDVITVERSRLVGRYIGDTERNMQEIIRQAQGNVLFIDEAYTLCDTANDRKDFGYRAIESLLTVLSAGNADILVIFAGYEDEMQRLMSANAGLRGRFAHHIRFDDFSADELMQIGKSMLQKHGYHLTPEASELLQRHVEQTLARRDRYFSNARWIEQLICNRILPATARRVMAHPGECSPRYLATIEAADVALACATPDTGKERRSIGFKG